jgi:hypothetical protein
MMMKNSHASGGANNNQAVVFRLSTKDFLKMMIFTGVPFGIIESLTSNSVAIGLFAGIFFGVLFTFAMWIVNAILEGRYRGLRASISRERRLICDGGATNKGNGGWMFFTENGLEFYPHKINLSSKRIIIPIRLIESTESTANKLIIKLSGDLSYEFIVSRNNDWKRCIDNELARVRAESPTGNDGGHTESAHAAGSRSSGAGNAKYVFISYSSKNQSEAESTREVLRDHGIRTWMAPYDIPAGSKYAHVINDAIEKCACVLLLLSEDSQASQFVEKEVERAVAYNKTIVSMHLDNCTLNSGFRYYLGNEQIVPVREIDAANPAVKKVIDGVRALINI